MATYSYEYDIFIAYAFAEGDWVSWFQSFLQNYLEPHFLNPKIYCTRPAGEGPGVEEHIKRVLETSAVLVIITSPLFVSREWFRKEYSWFLQAVEQHGNSTLVTGRSGRRLSRIFMVLRAEVSEEYLPDEMRNLSGYDFSTHLLVADTKFHEGVYTLANDIVEVLSVLRTD